MNRHTMMGEAWAVRFWKGSDGDQRTVLSWDHTAEGEVSREGCSLTEVEPDVSEQGRYLGKKTAQSRREQRQSRSHGDTVACVCPHCTYR